MKFIILFVILFLALRKVLVFFLQFKESQRRQLAHFKKPVETMLRSPLIKSFHCQNVPINCNTFIKIGLKTVESEAKLLQLSERLHFDDIGTLTICHLSYMQARPWTCGRARLIALEIKTYRQGSIPISVSKEKKIHKSLCRYDILQIHVYHYSKQFFF